MSAQIYPGADWEVSTPEAEGMDPVKFEAAMANMPSIAIVIRNGKIIGAKGDITRSGPLYSGSKTLLATLAGLMLQQGKVTMDTLIPWSDVPTPPLASLRHFLTMTSDYNLDPHSPGNHYAYSNSGAIHYGQYLIFTFYPGRTEVQAMRDAYLDKLGIQDTFDMVGAISGWGGGGFITSTRDLARIGYLILKGGVWKGEQLLPPWFVDGLYVSQIPDTATEGGLGSGLIDNQTTVTPRLPGTYSWGFWLPHGTNGYEGSRSNTVACTTTGSYGTSMHVIPQYDMILAGVNTVTTVSGGRISGALIDQFADAVVTNTTSSSVTRFTLINADTDQPIAGFDPLTNGAVVNLRALPTRNLNIAAITQPAAVGSVQFTLNGNAFRTESVAPYALAGDASGDYYPWTPAVGTYSLTAVPFSGSSASGSPGTPLTVSFTVVDQAIDSTPPSVTMTAPAPNATVQGTVTVSANATDNTGVAGVQFLLDGAPLGIEAKTAPYAVTWDTTGLSGSHTLSARARDAAGNIATSAPIAVTVGSTAPAPAAAVTSFALINADTDQPISGFDPIADGAVIQHSALPTSNLNIVARTSGSGIGSVSFILNGSPVRTENTAPYAIGGDTNGNYWPWSLPAGALTLTATPYSGTNATGTPAQALTVKFTVQ